VSREPRLVIRESGLERKGVIIDSTNVRISGAGRNAKCQYGKFEGLGLVIFYEPD
jgi:hypothetical protein